MMRKVTRCPAIYICFASFIASSTIPLSVQGQSRLRDPLASIPLEAERFPDGISPTHVYAKTELLNRSLNRIIQEWNEQQHTANNRSQRRDNSNRRLSAGLNDRVPLAADQLRRFATCRRPVIFTLRLETASSCRLACHTDELYQHELRTIKHDR